MSSNLTEFVLHGLKHEKPPVRPFNEAKALYSLSVCGLPPQPPLSAPAEVTDGHLQPTAVRGLAGVGKDFFLLLLLLRREGGVLRWVVPWSLTAQNEKSHHTRQT